MSLFYPSIGLVEVVTTKNKIPRNFVAFFETQSFPCLWANYSVNTQTFFSLETLYRFVGRSTAITIDFKSRI